VVASIGRVPAVFQEELGAAVNDLAERVSTSCVPPPPPSPPPAAEHGKGHGKGKGHKDKGGDED
jgi:hypothetical protein